VLCLAVDWVMGILLLVFRARGLLVMSLDRNGCVRRVCSWNVEFGKHFSVCLIIEENQENMY
jgi:hypothetical protein